MTQAYPLAWPPGWPRLPIFERKSGAFKRYGGALSALDGAERVLYELSRLDVRQADVVISTNNALRADGLPRSDRGEPADSGAAVYWTRKGKRQVMAIDRYDRVADNLAAIAATLEAMRAIERHGGGQVMERAFTGFTAIAGARAWWAVLGLDPNYALPTEINSRFRELSKLAHPDMPGGSHEKMAELTAARDAALKERAQ